MPKNIRATRVALALTNLASWRNEAKSQSATHLFPMLALIEQGAGKSPGTQVLLNETPHEFSFWDRYFRLDDGNADKPYFNPVTLRRAEAGFPHSNSATIRKNTFAGKWHAAVRTDTVDGENWSLDGNYADIFREKVLTRGANVARVPVLDVAILFFRKMEFADSADANTLEASFRKFFPQRNDDFDKIFVFHPEDQSHIFTNSVSNEDYDQSIRNVLVEDVRNAGEIPSPITLPLQMDLDDPVLVQVQQLLTFGTSGIILTGVPGTGKSYYAKRIAKHLVEDPLNDIFKVQFHPSYGYEDFVEGYRPDEAATSGYQIIGKTFVLACERAVALKTNNKLVVLVD